MSKPVVNLRLFVAAYPPEHVARALLDRLPELGLPPHRAAPLDQVHMTLQFVGDTPARLLDETLESVGRSASGIGPITLELRALVSLPERGPARLVAATTDAPPPLLELHRRLAHRLATNVRERRGERFLPHLTLCRFGAPTRGVSVEATIPSAHFEVREIRVMRSVLHPGGAEHHLVEAVEL